MLTCNAMDGLRKFTAGSRHIASFVKNLALKRCLRQASKRTGMLGYYDQACVWLQLRQASFLCSFSSLLGLAVAFVDHVQTTDGKFDSASAGQGLVATAAASWPWHQDRSVVEGA